MYPVLHMTVKQYKGKCHGCNLILVICLIIWAISVHHQRDPSSSWQHRGESNTESHLSLSASQRTIGSLGPICSSCFLTLIQSEWNRWVLGDIQEWNRKLIRNLHLREPGDWRKSCWSLLMSDGLRTLELIILQRAGRCLCLPATSYRWCLL